jgi:hypothetical protein
MLDWQQPNIGPRRWVRTKMVNRRRFGAGNEESRFGPHRWS